MQLESGDIYTIPYNDMEACRARPDFIAFSRLKAPSSIAICSSSSNSLFLSAIIATAPIEENTNAKTGGYAGRYGELGGVVPPLLTL